MSPPKFSVIIPARDEERLIGPCLESIHVAAATYPEQLEVIVVLNRCLDRSRQDPCQGEMQVPRPQTYRLHPHVGSRGDIFGSGNDYGMEPGNHRPHGQAVRPHRTEGTQNRSGNALLRSTAAPAFPAKNAEIPAGSFANPFDLNRDDEGNVPKV